MTVNARIEPLFRLNGKIALVTGASKGIGKDLSVRLVREGAPVLVADRPETEAIQTAADIDELAVACDVSKYFGAVISRTQDPANSDQS